MKRPKKIILAWVLLLSLLLPDFGTAFFMLSCSLEFTEIMVVWI